MSASFPVSTETLQHVLPHRPPATVVSEVLSVDAEGGTCLCKFTEPKEPTLAPEAMAQAFGYVMACQGETLSKAFLVGIKNVRMSAVRAKDWVVSVKRTRYLPPMVCVKGKVTTTDGELVAEGEIRLWNPK